MYTLFIYLSTPPPASCCNRVNLHAAALSPANLQPATRRGGNAESPFSCTFLFFFFFFLELPNPNVLPLQLFDTHSLEPPLYYFSPVVPAAAHHASHLGHLRVKTGGAVSCRGRWEEEEQPAHQRFRITGSGKNVFASQREAETKSNRPTLGWNQTYLFLFSGRLLKRSVFHRAAAAAAAFCSRRFSSRRRERRSLSSGQCGCCFSGERHHHHPPRRHHHHPRGSYYSSFVFLKGPFMFYSFVFSLCFYSQRQKLVFLMWRSKFEVKSELCS